MNHIKALDGWRGICAILVVLFHFAANSHFYDLGIIRNASLFVDFFFVLSGFVMAGNYQHKLVGGMPVSKFMWLRFARLYPLHVFVLGLFVVTELFFMNYVTEFSSIGRQAFDGQYSIPALFANIFMLQGLGVYDHLTWNGPSWSISTEFFAYVLLALFFRSRIIFVLLIAASPFLLLEIVQEGSRFWFVVRCMAGFSGGVLTYELYQRIKIGANTIVEIIAVLAIVIMVSFVPNPYSYMLAPFAFSLAVYVFAHEAGFISKQLATKPMQFLGKISFSVYLLHMFIQLRLINLGSLLEKNGLVLFSHRGEERFIGINEWWGDAAYVGMLAIVIFASWVTYTMVEVKGGKFLKAFWTRRAKQKG